MPFKYSDFHRVRLLRLEEREKKQPSTERRKAIDRLKLKIANFFMSTGESVPPVPAVQPKPKPKKRKRTPNVSAKTKRRNSYLEYINSDAWREFKASIIAERGKACESCLATPQSLDLHHLTYARFKNERREDVKLLCRKCHTAVHGVKEFSSKRAKRKT
jgi:5-methylcytosine-specific restriction endonuclease McrA